MAIMSKPYPPIQAILLALSIPMLIGCTSAPQQAEPAVCWQKESCLATTYPESQWYFAFAEDTLRNGQNVATVREA